MVNGTNSIKWHSAGQCNQLYDMDDSAYGSEIGDSNWICPLVDKITIDHNPPLYQTGNGTSFNMVVNTCAQAVQNDLQNGLTTYTDATCESETISVQNAQLLTFHSKVMSQDGTDPYAYRQTKTTQPYFTSRIQTMLLTTLGQTYRSSAMQQKVYFYDQTAWENWVPIVNWFYRVIAKSQKAKEEPDLITYQFDVDQSSFYAVDPSKLDPLYGLVNMSIAQSVEIQQKV